MRVNFSSYFARLLKTNLLEVIKFDNHQIVIFLLNEQKYFLQDK